MRNVALEKAPAGTPLKTKVAFLSRPDSYSFSVDAVEPRETHMSWVFLAGERVYKLKKPLRTRDLDFSTVPRREAACRAEFQLNRRLAHETYLDVVPLTRSPAGLAIGGSGEPVDWLVVMRRLDEELMLEVLLRRNRLDRTDIERLAGTLSDFYRHANRSHIAPAQHIVEWKRVLDDNRRILLRPELQLPAGLIRNIDRTQRAFLAHSTKQIAVRSRARFIVEAHGDLRPEHIWLGTPLQIIDCLEFNQRLRTLDILSEVAFLDLECDRLGAAWAGEQLRQCIFGRTPGLEDEALFRFFRSYHAMLRARLAIAHLLEPRPRKPKKWHPLALHYLRLAECDARRLSGIVKRPADR